MCTEEDKKRSKKITISTLKNYYHRLKKKKIKLELCFEHNVPIRYVLLARIAYCILQGVSKVRVLILTSGRTRQFMKLFSITFCKIRKSFPRSFAP
jgi:hypothetical protein